MANLRPHLARTAPNLMPNASADNDTDWFFTGPAVHDPTFGRTTNGSVKFPSSSQATMAIKSPLTPVQAGKTYTIGYYLYANSWPPPIEKTFIQRYDANGDPLLPQKGLYRECPGDANDWYEVVSQYTPEDGVAFIRVKTTIIDYIVGEQIADLWMDDYYVGEGVNFEQAPTAKTAFAGSRVRIDDLGNVERFVGGQWVPFFPRAIYPDAGGSGLTRDWSVFAPQGINTVYRPASVSDVQRAVDAGLLYVASIDGYMSPTHPDYGDVTKLQTLIGDLDTAGLLDTILCYGWDNENSFADWISNSTLIVAGIRVVDDGAMIYALNIQSTLARMYNSVAAQVQDATGAYMGTAGSGNTPFEPFLNQDRLERLNSPVVFAQFNNLENEPAGALRARAYKALAMGARGFNIYADDRPPTIPAAELQPWWPTLPQLAAEIDEMLPLIRQPHWTGWEATMTGGSTIVYGTRELNRTGYVIISNTSEVPCSATMSFKNLQYDPTKLEDVITGELIAESDGGDFTFTLDGYEAHALRLVHPKEKLPPVRKGAIRIHWKGLN